MNKRKTPITIEEIKTERWVNKLKNGDVKFDYKNKWYKQRCDRIRRNLQKFLDYQLKPHIWYNRKHVNPQIKGYNGDSYEDYDWWLFHGDYNPALGRYELDIYPDE